MKRLAGIMATLCLLLVSCAISAVPIQPYLDDLETVLTVRTELSALYTDTLKTVLKYTQTPEPENLEAAKAACVSAMEKITSLETVESSLSDEQRKEMSKLGIDQVDYTTPFRMQNYEKTVRLQTLSELLFCLNKEPLSFRLAASIAEANLAYESYDWQIEVTAVNILLVDIPEKELGAFRDTFLPELAALGGETLTWETDRNILEERADSVIEQIEALTELHARETGELYLELLSQERDLRSELERAGMEPANAEQLADAIEELETGSIKADAN